MEYLEEEIFSSILFLELEGIFPFILLIIREHKSKTAEMDPLSFKRIVIGFDLVVLGVDLII